MTTHVVTDDVLAAYGRKEWELKRRLMEGTLDPEKVISGLQNIIQTCSWPKFSIWRTIRHVGQRNAESYSSGLKSVGYYLGDWAREMLGQFSTTTVDEEVDLACCSVKKLGFKAIAPFGAICARIINLGFTLCLPEDGPVLCEQYLGHPPGESVLLAMKPLPSANRLSVFYVENSSPKGLQLHWGYGSYNHQVPSYTRIVFRLYKRPIVVRPVPSLKP